MQRLVVLVTGNLATLIASRSTRMPFWATLRRSNRVLAFLLAGATALLAVIVGVPPARELFSLSLPGEVALAVAVAAGVVPVLALDLAKRGGGATT